MNLLEASAEERSASGWPDPRELIAVWRKIAQIRQSPHSPPFPQLHAVMGVLLGQRRACGGKWKSTGHLSQQAKKVEMDAVIVFYRAPRCLAIDHRNVLYKYPSCCQKFSDAGDSK